jgi:excisionase family DNA binding protein
MKNVESHPSEKTFTDMLEPLLSIPEVAAQLRVSVRTIYRLIDDGKLPSPVKIGARSLIPVSAVVAYLKTAGLGKLKKGALK